jgi:hypothetical protein
MNQLHRLASAIEEPSSPCLPSEAGSGQTWIAVSAAVLLTLVGLGCEFLIWPDWDAAWLLAIARQMREGATLYSNDLVEINPPTIIECARLALRLSEVLGVEAITAWRLLVFAFVQLSLGLSLPLLHRCLRGNDAPLFLPAAVLLAAVLGCLPGTNFGQREHLILLLSMPYVLAAGLHISGKRLTLKSRVAYGAMLAVALSIKPHYALLVLFVEAGVVLCARRPWAWLRVETVSALAIVIVAAVSIALRYPGYASFAVPLALRFYGEYGEVQLSLSHAAYLTGATTGVLAMRLFRINATGPLTLLLAGVGAFVVFVVQRKGWDYQLVPARGYLVMAGGLAGLLVANAVATRAPVSMVSVRRLAVFGAVVMMLAVSALMARRTVNINEGHWPPQFSELMAVIERAQPTGMPRTMATLSIDMFPAFPVIEVMGGEWASRFSCLWMIPAIEARERAGGDAATPERSGRRYLTAAIAEDLARRQPTFLLIEEARSRLLDDILLAPAVRDRLGAYHRVGRVGTLSVWVRGASVGSIEARQQQPYLDRHAGHRIHLSEDVHGI